MESDQEDVGPFVDDAREESEPIAGIGIEAEDPRGEHFLGDVRGKEAREKDQHRQ